MLEIIRRLFVGLALAGVSCTGNRPPVTPPSPPPPSPVCAEGQATCCWHHPPDNEWLYACPAPEVPGGVLNVAGGPAQCPGQRCGGTTPPPEPPPGNVKFSELELRQSAPPRLTRGGQPFEPFGAIQCCMGFNLNGVEQNSRWPLASESWMDYTKANFFHFRLGPFYGDAAHESEWADTGGPYVGDGPDFNPAFWSKVRELVTAAGTRRANVEVVPIDTWYCKRASSIQGFRDQPMPWPQADIDACGISPSPEQERYIRKAVSELGCFANVVWVTDNEGGEIRGTKREWYEWVRNTIRDEEQKTGCGLVHLVGTNNTDFCDGPFDYCATHAREALTSPIAGKHTENNERNPEFSVEQEHSNFVTARAAGLHYWYWRAEQTDDQMERTLALFRGESPSTPVGCFPPPDDDSLWVAAPRLTTRADEVRAGQAQVGDMCKEPKAHENGNQAIAALNTQLRANGLCAGTVGATDHAMVLEEDGKTWCEYHAVAPFDTGCWSQRPTDYPINCFRYNGVWSPPPTQPPPAACTNPEPLPVSLWGVKEHTKGPNKTVVDSTPLVCDRAYCAAIGFTDGRSCCPVRQEGDPQRSACEAEVVGTPQWAGPGSVSPENPYQFWVPRGQSGVAKVCTSVTPQVCGQAEVTP